MKKQRRWLYGGWFLLLLLLVAVGPAVSRAEQQAPKPIVMILLDTSGSMQFAVDELVIEGVIPICHGSRQESFDYTKSRFAVAVEVLTGGFNNYWCQYDDRLDDPNREDYNYKYPHIIPRGDEVDGSEQKLDGLLDLYRDSVKFGLMTYDPLHGISDTVTGGYSYGANKNWSGGTYNLGARNEDAVWGRLVAPPGEDELDDIREANEAIEEQVLLSRPYNGTPVSPLLDDAAYFFANDDRVKPFDEASGDGDPYYDCRSKNIILITDGDPNLGEGNYGYELSEVAAAKLLAAGIKTHVVGFQMPASTLPKVNLIAKAGGTETAHIATSQSQLTSALGEILVLIQGNRPARSKLAITNRTMNSQDVQYHFSASYSGTSYSPLDQVGHLDQAIYRCNAGCEPEAPEIEESDDCGIELQFRGAGMCEVFSVSEALNSREAPRQIYTQLAGSMEEFSLENSSITADVLGIPTDGELAQLEPVVLPDGQLLFSGTPLGDASDAAVRNLYRDQLTELIMGAEGSRREHIKMGAIRNSQPTLQPNLFNVFAPLPSFTQYRNQEGIRDRPTVLFVGTHEGMMHAFRVDRLASEVEEKDYGTELWAFIPKHLLPELQRLGSGMDYLMDASPLVQEVRLSREEVVVDPDDEIERWRSVLMSGYGDGGRGYFALDVTRPEEFAFMWEISNTEYCYNVPDAASSCIETDTFERLGYTHSMPAIGSIFWSDAGNKEERAVAIFGGGESQDYGEETGKSVYVVNLETGALIMEFCNDCGNVSDTNTSSQNTTFLDCPMTGPVVAYDSYIGGIVTRAFIGDSCGQLWRLDLSRPDPEDWRLEFFHDAFQGESLKIKKAPGGFATGKAQGHGYGWKKNQKRRSNRLTPSLATGEHRGELVIVYGTGNPDELLQPLVSDRVYSLREKWDVDELAYVAEVHWELILEIGEVLTSAPLVFDGVAYFTTQTVGEGLCSTGSGRLWGLDFDGLPGDDATDDLEGMLDEDGCSVTTELVQYMEYQDAELSGFQLVQRPTCFESASGYEPWNDGVSAGAGTGQTMPWQPGTGAGGATYGGASSAPPELVVQFGESGVSSPEMSPPEGGGQLSTGTRSVQKMAAPAQTVHSTSWGLVFD